MRPSTCEITANAILATGSLAAVLAFAAYDAGADAGQLAFFVGALLQGLIVLVPALFMWGMLRGVADIKRDLSAQREEVERGRLSALLEEESVRKVIVEKPGREALVIERGSEEAVPEEVSKRA